MLTNIDWISTGEPFPPPCEQERLSAYKRNAALFDNKHLEVFAAHFATLNEYLKRKDVNVKTVLNYPQLLSKKTADFVCGEAPTITVQKSTSELLEQSNINSILYESIIDVSRFGNSVVKLTPDGLSVVPPWNWFPIVDETNQKKVLGHVLSFVVEDRIHIEMHTPGHVETRTYKAVTNAGQMEFGARLEDAMYNTGLDGMAVYTLSNVTHSGSLFGINDYDIILTLLERLTWRLYCLDLILDKHASPSMSGPKTALTQDPVTGLWLLKAGNYFSHDTNDEPEVKYVTWDGNVTAVQNEIEFLIKQLFSLTEMGSAFIDNEGGGSVESARALKLRMTSPLIKARRITNINTLTVKRIISDYFRTRGSIVDISDIAITWNDGLPDDYEMQSKILALATNGKPFMSQLTAIKDWSGYLSDEQAEQELAQIQSEDTSPRLSVFDVRGLDDDDGNTTDIS